MSKRAWTVITMMALGGLSVLGCDTPAEPHLEAEVEPRFARAGGAPIANGSGIQLRPVGNRAFTFTANRMPDGSTAGQIQLSIKGDVRIHMEVTCATSEGNQAFIGGVVTTSNVWEPGWKVGVVVEDNGKGRQTPDRISLLNASTVDRTFDQQVCDRDVDLSSQFFPVRGDLRVF